MNHRLPRLGVFVVAAAFLGYWALLLYCDVRRPIPLGLFLRFDIDRVVVVDIVPDGPARRAGLRTGDRIAAFDGHPIGSRLDWMTVETNLEIGRPIQLTVNRGDAILSVPITPELAPWQSWRLRQGPALLVVRMTQLVSLILGIVVAWKRSGDSTALVGSAFLATIGVFSLTLPYRFASVWRALPLPAGLLLWIPFLSSVAIAAWAFSFFVMFPRVRLRTPLAWCAIWIPVVPGLVGQAVFGYYTVRLRQPAPPLPPWTQSLVVVGVAYVFAGLAALVVNYRRLTDVNERRRVRVVMIGSVVGAAAGVPVVLSYWSNATSALDQSFLASPLATSGTFLFLILPLSFAYAILRHRLFDIGVMIRQGLRYALARHAVLALVPVLLVVLGVDLLAHGDEPVRDVLQSRAWLYITLIALAIVTRTRRQGWLDALDHRFFRERYNAQRLLREVAEDVRQAASLAPVAPAVVSRIEQALHPRFVALLVREPDGRSYRTVAVSPRAIALSSLNAGNRLLAIARLLDKPLDIGGSSTDWLARKIPPGDLAALQSAAIDLVVPVGSEDGEARALFVLGQKRSEEPYSEDDGELLMAIAESVAMRLPVRPAAAATTDRFEECPTCGSCYDSGTGRCHAEGTALVPVTSPRLLAGRYQLERRIGRGGMGTVYVALDTSLDRRVAATLVREDLVGLPGAAERFQREARVAAAFSHPNVVTVHDYGVSEGHAFLVMELLDGHNLRDLLCAEERIECHRALAILRGVTAAIEAAHRRQLLHRDLKPENICLVSQGAGETAKVLDFGIARFLTAKDGGLLVNHTTGGALLGTPWYMAPEQLRGEDPAPSWDLWALAVIAFEMLSGSHPFASMTLSCDPQTREPGIEGRLANVPAACRDVFARGLALEQAARPQSPAIFLGELERSLNA